MQAINQNQPPANAITILSRQPPNQTLKQENHGSFNILKYILISPAKAMDKNKRKPLISIVSAVFGVSEYIDEFITSITKQTIGVENLELILVDDYSDDGSFEKCLEWAERLPELIKVARLEKNLGQGAARNHGIEMATGTWINFADPDDFLDSKFFSNLISSYQHHPNAGLIIGQLRSYYPNRWRKSKNDHTLGWRFKSGNKLANVLTEPEYIHLHVNSALFLLDAINSHNVRFDPNLKPTFEDGLFTNQYTLRSRNYNRLFVPSAYYHYRKRAEKNSSVDTAWDKKEQYLNVPKYGSLSLLKECIEIHGAGLDFIHKTAVYNLSFYFKKNFGKSLIDSPLNRQEAEECVQYIRDALRLIPSKHIHDLKTVNLSEEMRMQMLSLGGHPLVASRSVNVIDAKAGRARLSYLCCLESDDLLSINGNTLTHLEINDVPNTLLGVPVATMRYVWVTLPTDPVDETNFRVGKTGVLFTVRGKWAAKNRRARKDIARKITGCKNHFTFLERLFLKKAAEAGRVEYKDCWLFYERLQKADDNAEHLYRYVKENHPEINAYFILNKKSGDWGRLKAEGFNLLEYNSYEHKCAYLNADHIISSHAEVHLFRLFDHVAYSSVTKAKYHFLQHGTISNDLSKWLNEKPLSTFVTTTIPEFTSIAFSPAYAFSFEVVSLSGQPRHDRLLEIAKKQTTKKILIMPTWRKWLVKKGKQPGTWKRIEKFRETTYFKNWNRLLNSSALKTLHNEGYEIEFHLHDILKCYENDFGIPPHVRMGNTKGISVQETFGSSEIMITDYSSVAFEMALQRKPVLYFHFDFDEFFSGKHTYQRGYYNYEEQGFGPVFKEVDSLEQYLTNYPSLKQCLLDKVVIPRACDQIPNNDGHCCRRLLERIIDS